MELTEQQKKWVADESEKMKAYMKEFSRHFKIQMNDMDDEIVKHLIQKAI